MDWLCSHVDVKLIVLTYNVMLMKSKHDFAV